MKGRDSSSAGDARTTGRRRSPWTWAAAAAVLLLAPTFLLAEATLVEFRAGDSVRADQVNGNFATLAAGIAELESKVADQRQEIQDLQAAEQGCVLMKACSAPRVDRGAVGIIMQGTEYFEYCPQIGSAGGGFHSDWTWCHPRLCCMP